jgi:hypothetical protein
VKSGHGKPYFLFRAYLKSYLRVCIKADDILKVRNALIKVSFPCQGVHHLQSYCNRDGVCRYCAAGSEYLSRQNIGIGL